MTQKMTLKEFWDTVKELEDLIRNKIERSLDDFNAYDASDIYRINTRVKPIESFKKKVVDRLAENEKKIEELFLKHGFLHFLKHIGDFFGVRVVVATEGDKDFLVNLILLMEEEKRGIFHFLECSPTERIRLIESFDWPQSGRDEYTISPRSYTSIHINLRMNLKNFIDELRISAPEAIKKMKFDKSDEIISVECQLRTVGEDYYAEMDHLYNYKQANIQSIQILSSQLQVMAKAATTSAESLKEEYFRKVMPSVVVLPVWRGETEKTFELIYGIIVHDFGFQFKRSMYRKLSYRFRHLLHRYYSLKTRVNFTIVGSEDSRKFSNTYKQLKEVSHEMFLLTDQNKSLFRDFVEGQDIGRNYKMIEDEIKNFINSEILWMDIPFLVHHHKDEFELLMEGFKKLIKGYRSKGFEELSRVPILDIVVWHRILVLEFCSAKDKKTREKILLQYLKQLIYKLSKERINYIQSRLMTPLANTSGNFRVENILLDYLLFKQITESRCSLESTEELICYYTAVIQKWEVLNPTEIRPIKKIFVETMKKVIPHDFKQDPEIVWMIGDINFPEYAILRTFDNLIRVYFDFLIEHCDISDFSGDGRKEKLKTVKAIKYLFKMVVRSQLIIDRLIEFADSNPVEFLAIWGTYRRVCICLGVNWEKSRMKNKAEDDIWKLVKKRKIFLEKQVEKIEEQEIELDDRVKRLTERLGKTGEIFTP